MSGESDSHDRKEGDHAQGGKAKTGRAPRPKPAASPPASKAKSGDGAASGGAASIGAAPGSSGTAARSLDILTILIAAILGAVIALGVQYAVDASGLRPGTASTGSGDLERRVAALEQADGGAGGGASIAAVADLRGSFERLQDEVAALAARAGGGGATDLTSVNRAINDVQTQLERSQARLNNLETRTPDNLIERLERFAAAESVAALDARVAQLEADALQNDTRRAAMGLGLAQLARAAQGARPFEQELAAIALLRPGDPLVAQFAPHAQDGVPTFAMVRDDFPSVAREVARAAHRPEEVTAWGRVWSWLGRVISFRKTGDTEGDDANAILARAERHLDEGDLAAALSEMTSLPDGARTPAADWIAAAQGRVALDRLTTALSLEIIAELGQ